MSAEPPNDLTVAIANIIYRGFNSETMGWSEALGKAKEIEELTMGDASARKDEDAAPLSGSTNSPVRCDIWVRKCDNTGLDRGMTIEGCLHLARSALTSKQYPSHTDAILHIDDALAALRTSEPVMSLQPLRDELDIIASASLRGEGVAGRIQTIITRIDDGKYAN